MKKYKLLLVVSVVIVAVVSVFLISAGNVANAEQAATPHYDLLSEFLTVCPERTAGVGVGERRAASFIAEKFTGYGLTCETEAFRFNGSDNVSYESNNVIAVKPAAAETKKTVILHAKLDNLASYETNGAKLGGTGAYSGGVAVTALLGVAAALSGLSFDFNIIFLAHGASEFGGRGLIAFFDTQRYKDIGNENVLLAVEFNRLGGGDYTYVYGDEVETPHHDMFLEDIEKEGLGLLAPPAYKRPALNVGIEQLAYPYLHPALTSDSSFFLSRGVNAIMYESFNWSELSSSVYTEMSGLENVLHTSGDTLETMVARKGGAATVDAEIEAVVRSVATTLQRQDFVARCESSVGAANDYRWFLENHTYILLGIGMGGGFLIFLAFTLFMRRTRKQAIEARVDVPPEDPFDLSGGEVGDSSDGDGLPPQNDNIFDGF